MLHSRLIKEFQYLALLTIIVISSNFFSEPTLAQRVGTIGPIYGDRPSTNDPDEDKYVNKKLVRKNSYYSVRVVGTNLAVPDAKISVKNIPGFGTVDVIGKPYQVLVTSSVMVKGYPQLATPVMSINRIQLIEPRTEVSLGINPILIEAVPTLGSTLTLEVKYIVQEKTPISESLSKFSDIVNSSTGPLSATLTLKGADMLTAAAGVTSIVSKLTTDLFPVKDEPALSFIYNVPIDELKSKYVYFIGALPTQNLISFDEIGKLKVKPVTQGGQAYLVDDNNKEFKKNSYIIFQIDYLPELKKFYDAEWLNLYKISNDIVNDLDKDKSTSEELNTAYQSCTKLIDQAKDMAKIDNRFLDFEKNLSDKEARNNCNKLKTLAQSSAQSSN